MEKDRKLGVKRREGAVRAEAPGRAGGSRLKPSDNHAYFDAVARHGSIRKAAEALHMASSALNRRILDLEGQVGTALFERLPRGVRPTAAGELLLAHVRRSMKELHKVEAQIDQLRGEARGLVRIAVAESVTPSLLPRAVAAYQQVHAGVGFHAIVDGPELLQQALLSDDVDLILTHEAPDKPNVSVLASAVHPLCALVSPEHPLAARKQIHLGDCVGYPLALPDHTLAARALLDLAFEEASMPVLPSLESDSVETLKAFARLGDAICFSFHLGDVAEIPGLVALRLLEPYCEDARLYLVARRGRVLPVAAASFAEQLRERFAALTDPPVDGG